MKDLKMNNYSRKTLQFATLLSRIQNIARSANQGGFVLASAMIMITGLMLISVVSVQDNLWHNDETGRLYQSNQTFYVAEAGAEWGQQWLWELVGDVAHPTQDELDGVTQPDINGYSYPELSITKNDAYNGIVSKGAFAGMEAYIRPYSVRSHAANHNELVEKIITVTVNQESIPMGNFGIYYGEDLEFFTDYPLDYNGRIHTNGNLYIGSSNVLNVIGDVTVGGHIYNTPKDSTRSYNGKARFQDETGHWSDLSYDSRDSNWEEQSLEDWGGRVLDQAHGVGLLPYPLPTPGDAIEIIKRGEVTDDDEMRAMRFYYKAGLRILDGVAFDSIGIPVALPSGIFSTDSIYDHREQKTINLVNLDIAALDASGYFPANGILYISESSNDAAIRLINGQQIPASGLAIATDNPVYIWGHFNTVNTQPSSILCDAFNVLSWRWNDGDSDRPLNQRVARATTIKTSVITGNVPTSQGSYSGGAENLIRLHEKWVGHELTYRGSLICIWNSDIATGLWENASYVEAHRDWGFDPSLLDDRFWPEESLTMTRVSRGSWSQN